MSFESLYTKGIDYILCTVTKVSQKMGFCFAIKSDQVMAPL